MFSDDLWGMPYIDTITLSPHHRYPKPIAEARAEVQAAYDAGNDELYIEATHRLSRVAYGRAPVFTKKVRGRSNK